MKRRHSTRDTITIADEILYQQAVQEMLDAYEQFAEHNGSDTDEEHSKTYRASEAAAHNSWNAVTAMIDCYVARRISETLEKL